MEFQITDSPGFSKLDATFAEGEKLYAQPRSMIYMSTGFTISAHVGGASGNASIVGGVKSMLSGESFATAIYTAKRSGETVSLAPSAIGEISMLELNGSAGYYLTKGAYLAHEDGVILTPKFGGMKGWLTKKGIYLLHVSGTGRCFVSSYGAIIKRTLAEGERLIVDNEYVLVFADTIRYELVTASAGIKDSLMSGEGLVNRYTGPGELYIQTRSRQRGSVMGSILNMAT